MLNSLSCINVSREQVIKRYTPNLLQTLSNSIMKLVAFLVSCPLLSFIPVGHIPKSTHENYNSQKYKYIRLHTDFLCSSIPNTFLARNESKLARDNDGMCRMRRDTLGEGEDYLSIHYSSQNCKFSEEPEPFLISLDRM